MKANTSLSLVALATSLALHATRRARLARTLLPALAALIGATVLFEYATGWDLHVDQLIAREPRLRETADYAPNRMSPAAAIAILLVGSTFLLTERGRARAAQWTGGLAFALGSFALMGFLYDTTVLYEPAALIRISVFTASATVCLSLGAFSLRRDVGLGRTFTSEGPGGFIARRLVAPLVLLPVV